MTIVPAERHVRQVAVRIMPAAEMDVPRETEKEIVKEIVPVVL